jgi:hypothetical protein
MCIAPSLSHFCYIHTVNLTCFTCLASIELSVYVLWFYREVLGLYALLYALNLDKVTRMNSVSVLRTLTQTLFILVFGLAFHHQFNYSGAESFNSHFSDQFNSPHPTFYVFWYVVIKQHAVTYTIASSLSTTAPITRCQNKTFFNGNGSGIPVEQYHAYNT